MAVGHQVIIWGLVMLIIGTIIIKILVWFDSRGETRTINKLLIDIRADQTIAKLLMLISPYRQCPVDTEIIDSIFDDICEIIDSEDEFATNYKRDAILKYFEDRLENELSDDAKLWMKLQ